MSSPAKSPAKKLLDRGAALRRFEVAVRGHLAVAADGQAWLASSKWVRSAASRSFRISIRKCGFGSHVGRGRIEAGGAVFDGVAAVGRERLAGAQHHASSGSGVRPLTG